MLEDDFQFVGGEPDLAFFFDFSDHVQSESWALIEAEVECVFFKESFLLVGLVFDQGGDVWRFDHFPLFDFVFDSVEGFPFGGFVDAEGQSGCTGGSN